MAAIGMKTASQVDILRLGWQEFAIGVSAISRTGHDILSLATSAGVIVWVPDTSKFDQPR
jgi:hypothetical protein